MGKLYLSNTLKINIVTLGAYIKFMENLDQEYTKSNQSKDLLKAIRTSNTWGRKAINHILRELHPDEVEKLVGRDRLNIINTGNSIVRYMEHSKKGDVDKYEVVVRYTDQAIREHKAIQELDKNTTVATDDLTELTSLAIASCSLCTCTGDDVESCKFRRIFLRYDIEPINTEPGNGCPYRK